MLSFLLLLSSWTLKIAKLVFERIFHHPYSRILWKFNFGGHHLGFQAQVDVMRYRKWHHWKACPREYGDSGWNFLAMCSRTRDMPGGQNTPKLPANVAKKLSPGQGLTCNRGGIRNILTVLRWGLLVLLCLFYLFIYSIYQFIHVVILKAYPVGLYARLLFPWAYQCHTHDFVLHLSDK